MDEREARVTGTVVRGVCEECGRYTVLTAKVDPESPLTDTLQLCASCARAPEPFFYDDR